MNAFSACALVTTSLRLLFRTERFAGLPRPRSEARHRGGSAGRARPGSRENLMKRTLRRAAAPVAAAGIVGAIVAGFLLGNGSGSGVAADGAEPAVNSVAVAGTGLVSGVPDVLRLEMGIQHNGGDVNEALNATNDDVVKIKKALDKYHVDSKDIQTSQLSINPHYVGDGKVE